MKLDIEDMLARASKARVAVVGDFCLDAYWDLDDAEPEISIETGLPTRRVRKQRYSPGGAGNVAMNLAALGVAKVTAFGLVGDDPFGPCLKRLMRAAGIDCANLLCSADGWQTCVYSKPCTHGIEGNRIDFGAFNSASEQVLAQIAASLEEAAATHDAIIVNRQLEHGLINEFLEDAINRIAAEHHEVAVIVDARNGAWRFSNAVLKLNENEAIRIAQSGNVGNEAQAAADACDTARLASLLHIRTGRAVFITRGEKGLVAAANGETIAIDGIRVPPPIDPVGAGDCMVSALAATLPCANESADSSAYFQSARFANLAASIILGKLNTTGTASPEELRAAATRL